MWKIARVHIPSSSKEEPVDIYEPGGMKPYRYKTTMGQFLSEGWEPFAATDFIIYFRMKVNK